jgi:hypothetical protein
MSLPEVRPVQCATSRQFEAAMNASSRVPVLLCAIALLVTPLAALDVHAPVPPPTVAMDHAFERMYNFDFSGTHAILDGVEREDPSYPLAYSVRAAALLFSELYRMKILETEFFTDDERVTDKRIKADPTAHAEVFRATGEARKRAAARLAADAGDREAMFAMCMATGVESDYTILVEKRYFRSFSLSRESQAYAHRLLTLDPPVYDAYLTLGSVEYVVGSMNFFFRLFVHFDQIKGSKEQGIENLKRVIAGGRYFPPFAKILLSVIYLREQQPELALPLLTDLTRSYPENALLRKEAGRVRSMTGRSATKKAAR